MVVDAGCAADEAGARLCNVRLAPRRCSPERLTQGIDWLRRRDRPHRGGFAGDGKAAAPVLDLKRRARAEPVRRGGRGYLDLQLPALEGEGERDSGQRFGQSGREGEAAVVLAGPGEAGDHGRPAAGQGGEVQAIGGVMCDVVVIE